MNTFNSRVLLTGLCLLPAVGYAASAAGGIVAAHWDSVVLVAIGALVVWREVNVAMQGQAKQRHKNGWSALDSWRRPAKTRTGWMPVLAKLVTRRSRR